MNPMQELETTVWKALNVEKGRYNVYNRHWRQTSGKSGAVVCENSEESCPEQLVFSWNFGLKTIRLYVDQERALISDPHGSLFGQSYPISELATAVKIVLEQVHERLLPFEAEQDKLVYDINALFNLKGVATNPSPFYETAKKAVKLWLKYQLDTGKNLGVPEVHYIHEESFAGINREQSIELIWRIFTDINPSYSTAGIGISKTKTWFILPESYGRTQDINLDTDSEETFSAIYKAQKNRVIRASLDDYKAFLDLLA